MRSPSHDALTLQRKATWLPALVWLASFVVFAVTAYHTITWWESSSHSLAAAILGITSPPGSLLLTLLGWLVTRIPTGLAPAHTLNLLAAALAATTVVLVLRVALQLLREPGDSGDTGATRVSVALGAGAAAGALTFAFSTTLWQYAIQFTPYVLTTVFTGLLLWTLLRWWDSVTDPRAWRWLFVLGLLFGLDYSVHRTNALLMPGALAWILIRQPSVLRRARTWIAGAGGLLAGLVPQLLIIPLAARHPSLNIGDPSAWSRFYDYESLAQFGGGFLVQFYPRHAAVWSVQVMDLLRAFGANFLWLSGRWAILGALPALLGVVGWLGLWRRERRLGVAFAVLLVLHAAFTVAYFNIPPHYFRSLDRHYLPVFVTWGVLVCCGAAEVVAGLRELSRRGPWHVAQWAGALLLVVPLSQLAHNWRTHDAAHSTFAQDFAANLLHGLPSRAILFTWGDNDTFPLMYLQAVAHVRPDVQIVNVSLTNAPWYVGELTRKDPSFPLPRGYADSHGAQAWRDTTFVIPVAGPLPPARLPEHVTIPRSAVVIPGPPLPSGAAQFGLPADLTLPRSIAVHVPPRMPGKYILLSDLVLLQILEHNNWQRPLCFSTTGETPGLPGLAPYARLDGLFWRIVPYKEPAASRGILRRSLLHLYQYRGYADAGVPLDEMSRMLALNYYPPLVALARAEYVPGEADRCRQSLATVLGALPLARLQPDATLRREIAGACAGPAAGRP